MPNSVLNMTLNSNGVYNYNPFPISLSNTIPYQPSFYSNFSIYNEIINKNNNLISNLNGENSSCIRLWRDTKNNYYFIDNAGQEHSGSKEEIESILTGMISKQINIVDDISLVRIDQYSMNNIIYLSIISIPLILQDIFEFNSTYNIVYNKTGNFLARNLLAKTRFYKESRSVNNANRNNDFISKLLKDICTDNLVRFNPISNWIKSSSDNILVLIGDQKTSNIISDRIIMNLFDNGVSSILTEDIIERHSFKEIVQGKLFLIVKKMPIKEENKKKLKELIIILAIDKKINSGGETITTQTKLLIFSDDSDSFFKDIIEFTNILYIKTHDEILSKINITSATLLQNIEKLLNDYSSQLLSYKVNFNSYSKKNNNDIYLKTFELNNEQVNLSHKHLEFDSLNGSIDSVIPLEKRIHTYIIGETGSGKTENVKSLAYNDYKRGNGSVILLDPHGDLAREFVKLPFKEDDLVIIQPSLSDELSFVLNLFNMKEKNERDIEKSTNMIVAVINNVNEEDKLTAAMEEMAYNIINIILTKTKSDIMDIISFLSTNNAELIKLGKNSDDFIIQNYFSGQFQEAKSTQEALRRRIRKLLTGSFRRITSGENTIDLEELMNTRGKMVVISVTKSDLGDNFIYFNRFILGLIQIYTSRRSNIEELYRIPTYLYIDEFQNFITPKIKEMLTEGRKFKLFLTLANQSIVDIPSNLRDIVLSNTNVKLVAKNSNKTLEAINKTLNTKLEDVESLEVGEFYLSVANNAIVKISNSNSLIDGKYSISSNEYDTRIKHQLKKYYRLVKPKSTSRPTKEKELIMIQQFKADLIFKNILDDSCLVKVKSTSPQKYKEIIDDFEYVKFSTDEYKPRIRRQEINTLFKLSFELDYLIDNTKFIKMLKGDNDMFENSSTGTRSKEFSDNNKSETEQYYYYPIVK